MTQILKKPEMSSNAMSEVIKVNYDKGVKCLKSLKVIKIPKLQTELTKCIAQWDKIREAVNEIEKPKVAK